MIHAPRMHSLALRARRHTYSCTCIYTCTYRFVDLHTQTLTHSPPVYPIHITPPTSAPIPPWRPPTIPLAPNPKRRWTTCLRGARSRAPPIRRGLWARLPPLGPRGIGAACPRCKERGRRVEARTNGCRVMKPVTNGVIAGARARHGERNA